ncbi:YmaF family protein [Dendrosporobacter sp. 1207_IL3150]|uniref:YmaF family protein n=1 Tax=Dendrosporobacter sp. 1207_IL3150 TaxID=3084054 RepID=UPI002FD9068E
MADEARQTIVGELDEKHSLHVHSYNTETDVADEHQHVIMGVSGPMCPQGNSHVHRVRGRTTFFVDGDEGHWHWYDVMSGPAIAMPDGTHTHYFSGETSVDDGHSHSFADNTALGPNEIIEDDEDDDDDCPNFAATTNAAVAGATSVAGIAGLSKNNKKCKNHRPEETEK